jgi:heat shock protein HslJ
MLERRFLLVLVLAGCSSGGGNTDSARTRGTDTTRGGGAPVDTVAAAVDTVAAVTADTSRRSGIALPFRARGNEPGWSLDVGEREMTLVADYGERRVVAATPAPVRSGDTTRWAARAPGHEVLVTVVDRLCHDGMSGFPFPRTVVVRLDGRELSGCGGESVDVLRGSWIVREIEGAAVPEDSRPTLIFGADGRVSGRAPCNRLSASYSLRGDELTFSAVSTTRMACAPAVMQREQRFVAVLGAVRRFERPGGDTLVLLTDDGRAIVARP